MPRDYSRPPRPEGRPPRAEGRPPRGPRKPGHFGAKPWERDERPREEGSGERGYRKPFGERRDYGHSGGERRDFRPPPRRDDEMYVASGKVADIVGTTPQTRHDMLNALWRFFYEEGLIMPASRRPPARGSDWRHGEGHRSEGGDDRPPRRIDRKPAGNHPAARRAKSLEGVPRRKYKETRDK